LDESQRLSDQFSALELAFVVIKTTRSRSTTEVEDKRIEPVPPMEESETLLWAHILTSDGTAPLFL
jgi:hypothetical protein